MQFPHTPPVESFLREEVVEHGLVANLYIPHSGPDTTHSLVFWNRAHVRRVRNPTKCCLAVSIDARYVDFFELLEFCLLGCGEPE